MTETFEKLWEKKVKTEIALDEAFAAGDAAAIEAATPAALAADAAYEAWSGDPDTAPAKAAPATVTPAASGIDAEIDELVTKIKAIAFQPGRDGGLDDRAPVDDMQRRLNLLVARRADEQLAAPFVGRSDIDLESAVEKAGLEYEKAVELRDSFSTGMSKEGKHVARQGAARRLAEAEAVVTEAREREFTTKGEVNRRSEAAAWQKARAEMKDSRIKREATEALDRHYTAAIEKAKAVAARDPDEGWYVGKLESEWRKRREEIPEKLLARVEADVEAQLVARYG